MNKEAFVKMYEERGYDAAAVGKATKTVEVFEGYLASKGLDFISVQVDDIKQYIKATMKERDFKVEELLAIARYFSIAGNNEVYIYFTKVLGGLGVIDSIKARIEKYAGKEALEEIFDGLDEPPLGTPMEQIPKFTQKMMERIERTTRPSVFEKFLAGNNHGIPKAAMRREKLLYEQAQSMEEYLKGRHERKVSELQKFCDSGEVWFEQQITQPVVDYVKSNQEILSAVKKGSKLYVTKIPFDTPNYLTEQDPKKKRYYACHCPFARESILPGEVNVSENWCYCSAGFAKFPYEVILDRELDVKLLKSPLKGDMVCRFEIDLGEDFYATLSSAKINT